MCQSCGCRPIPVAKASATCWVMVGTSVCGTASWKVHSHSPSPPNASVTGTSAAPVRSETVAGPAGIRAVDELLSAGTQFDALFCFNDLLALGAMEALRRHGVDVPADVAVVGFDDIEEGRHTVPGLTTVAVDLTVLAGAAVDSLVHRLDDPSTPDGDSILVPHRLVVRGSTVPPRTTGGAAG